MDIINSTKSSESAPRSSTSAIWPESFSTFLKRGVLLQNVSKADVLLNYQWYFIPAGFFIVLVLAFVFVGDGLRDAADPYASTRK